MVGDSSCGIHHPQGDIKKISFDYGFTALTNYLGHTSGSTHLRVFKWDDGTTEPGSSGSPLFNKQKRIVGQLHGGYASCTIDSSDWYGKFARSWLGGGVNTNSLKPWLDPDNTGALTLDGFDPNRSIIITHSPLADEEDTSGLYEVLCTIEAETTLVADSLLLYYTINNVTTLDTLEPTLNPDEFQAFIPAQPIGAIVEYYIYAQNVLGESKTSDVYVFEVIGPPYVCGDFDHNQVLQNIIDLTYWVDYVFRGGPPALDLRAADVNGTGTIENILELTYMVDYIFRGGLPPACP